MRFFRRILSRFRPHRYAAVIGSATRGPIDQLIMVTLRCRECGHELRVNLYCADQFAETRRRGCAGGPS